MRKLLGTLLLFSISLLANAQRIEQNFKELFDKVFVSSTGEMLTLAYHPNYRNELVVEFLKINDAGEYFRKRTTEIDPINDFPFVKHPDTICFINSQGVLKKFDFNGELLEILYLQEVEEIMLNLAGQNVISKKTGYDATVLKLTNDGQEVWSNFIADCKSITIPLEVSDGYIVGLHKVNVQRTDPIEFIKYDFDGEVLKKSEYNLNDDVVALHRTNNGFIAVMRKNLIGLNNALDTLWTRKVADYIEGSQATASGVYFYHRWDGHGITKIDFNGNIIGEIEEPEASSFIRAFTVTEDDQVIFSCSTQVNDYRTILVKHNFNEVLGNKVGPSNSFNLYPNPVSESNSFHITSGFEIGTLMIFDQKGTKVREVSIDNQDVEVEHSLKKGLYFYQIYQNNEIQTSGKIIVN